MTSHDNTVPCDATVKTWHSLYGFEPKASNEKMLFVCTDLAFAGHCLYFIPSLNNMHVLHVYINIYKLDLSFSFEDDTSRQEIIGLVYCSII